MEKQTWCWQLMSWSRCCHSTTDWPPSPRALHLTVVLSSSLLTWRKRRLEPCYPATVPSTSLLWNIHSSFSTSLRQALNPDSTWQFTYVYARDCLEPLLGMAVRNNSTFCLLVWNFDASKDILYITLLCWQAAVCCDIRCIRPCWRVSVVEHFVG